MTWTLTFDLIKLPSPLRPSPRGHEFTCQFSSNSVQQWKTGTCWFKGTALTANLADILEKTEEDEMAENSDNSGDDYESDSEDSNSDDSNSD